MIMRTLRLATLIIITISAGCINSAVRVQESSADLSQISSLFVERFQPDTHDLDELIANELRQMGFQATSGGDQPEQVDAVVTYRDTWWWDFTMYMSGIAIKIRDPDTGFPLAEGNSIHGSLTRQTPKEMVREVLNNIFGQDELRIGRPSPAFLVQI